MKIAKNFTASPRCFWILSVLMLSNFGASSCACKRYQIAIFPNADLKEQNAIPVEIYFPPPGEEVSRCQEIRNSKKNWFDSGNLELLKSKTKYIVRRGVVESAQPVLIEYPLEEEVGMIFIWGDYSEGVAPENRSTIKDPKTLQKCRLEIRVGKNGLSAN